MSRLGKMAVTIPAGCQVRQEGAKIIAKGPKGELSFAGSDDVEVKIEGNVISFAPRNENKRARAMWGTTAPRCRTSSPARPRASRRSSRSTASAIAPPSPARCCSSRSATAMT